MAGIVVIIDGLDDIPYAELNGKTPLEFGGRESFRQLEQAGTTGLFRTIPDNREADTMQGVLTLLGQKPEDIPTGRGYLEALAQGLVVDANDLVLRGNFVELAENGTLRNPCCAPPEEIQRQMQRFLVEQGVQVHSFGEGKVLLLCGGEKSSLATLTTFPPHEQVGKRLEEILPRGNKIGEHWAENSRALFRKFAPYTLLPWAQSVKMTLPSFQQLHGKTAALLTGKEVVKGIGKAMQIDLVNSPDFTGETDTNLIKKAVTAAKLSQQFDVVIVHIGGTDEATHRRSPREKADFITRIDRELLAYLLQQLPEEKSLLVTADHGAFCATGEHSHQPVPFWQYRKQERKSVKVGTIEGRKAIGML